MNALFFLTSALNTKFGVYDNAQRLNQTLATFDSIRRHCPGAKIAFAEMAGVSPTDAQVRELSLHVDYWFDYTQDDAVRAIYESTENWDIVKNTTESMVTPGVLSIMLADGRLKDIDRVFKMTSRYTLTDAFDPAFYDTVPDRMVILKPQPSQFPPQVTGGKTTQYMCRLFSWPVDQTQVMIDTYNTGFVAMAEHLNSGGYFDLEHMLYHYLPKDTVLEVDRLGLAGNLGPNGRRVED
jgi:hypothetical protein